MFDARAGDHTGPRRVMPHLQGIFQCSLFTAAEMRTDDAPPAHTRVDVVCFSRRQALARQ